MIADVATRFEPRSMRHPGPAPALRLVTASEPSARAAIVALPAGIDLLTGLVDAAGDAPAAVFTLLSGEFSQCVHCLAASDATGHTVATYSGWMSFTDTMVLGGSATIGSSVDGTRMVHSHAWFSLPATGALGGGHLDPVRCIVGAGGLRLRATIFERIDVRQAPDAETNHAVFAPVTIGEAA
ncbi:hypothetical protein [Oceaniradius stylonematis]|jgi:hypothetical protein|uniref:hypothetical protein n=1 Tax=Oceaniradius stylonematis TaxID=2184161 RepID=UPI00273E0651|nr:hypothetical protein [Oceaniradius stylonematis]